MKPAGAMPREFHPGLIGRPHKRIVHTGAVVVRSPAYSFSPTSTAQPPQHDVPLDRSISPTSPGSSFKAIRVQRKPGVPHTLIQRMMPLDLVLRQTQESRRIVIQDIALLLVSKKGRVFYQLDGPPDEFRP